MNICLLYKTILYNLFNVLHIIFCLERHSIQSHLLYHRKETITSGRRKMLLQTDFINKIKISIKNFLWSMSRKNLN